MKSKELRAVIITLVFGMAVLGSVIAVKTYLDYRSSLTAVTFTYNTVENATVSLFKGAKKDLVEPVTQGEGKVIESGKSYELEDWPYVIVINGNDIEESKRVVYPQQVEQNIALSVNKSSASLQKQLDTENQSLQRAIFASNPKIKTLYKLEKTKLHGDGSWASVSLVYAGAEKMSRDTLHVILRSTDGKWSVVAGPSITIHKSKTLSDAPESIFWSVLPEPVPAT